MRKGWDGEWKRAVKIAVDLTNIIPSQPPERRQTATPVLLSKFDTSTGVVLASKLQILKKNQQNTYFTMKKGIERKTWTYRLVRSVERLVTELKHFYVLNTAKGMAHVYLTFSKGYLAIWSLLYVEPLSSACLCNKFLGYVARRHRSLYDVVRLVLIASLIQTMLLMGGR